MRIAIIGANGFVGTRLVEWFLLRGQHVVVPVVRRASALALCARFEQRAHIADALNMPQLSAALAGCDAVIHVALGDPRQIEAMPAVLCAAAARARVPRVIYLSSAMVHGPAPAIGTNEDSPLHTRHAMDYGNAKVRAEKSFDRAVRRHALEGFALRPGVVIGPRSRWITDLANDLRQRRAWLLGAGSGICNTLYVDNLAAAIEGCLTAPATAAGAYLIGDTECVTWAEFYRAVARGLHVPIETIHHGASAPRFAHTPAERLARVVSSGVAQSFLPWLPSRLKQVGKRLATALTTPGANHDAWRLPCALSPRITEELALLQTNTWQLPSTRAATRLGYLPPVAFPDAIQRSLAWLAFAEGRS